MKENVVTSIFAVESEAYQAFSELKAQPAAEGYVVVEAALLKREGETVNVDDFFGFAEPGDNAAAGIVIGSLVGVLGGPLGVVLGAGYGALVGNTVEAFKDYDAMSVVEVLAGKLYEGETAVVALVAEDEPAFDKALEKFDVTIMRHDAATIAQEAQLAQQLDEEITRKAYLELRAEHKAEFEKMREEQAAAIKEKIKEYSESGLAFHAGI